MYSAQRVAGSAQLCKSTCRERRENGERRCPYRPGESSCGAQFRRFVERGGNTPLKNRRANRRNKRGQNSVHKSYFRYIVSLISHFVNLGRPKIPVRGGNAPRYRSLWRYHASPHARSRVTKTTPRAVHRPHKFLPPRYSCSPRTARRTSGCFLCPPWPTCSAPPSGAALLTTAVAEIPRVRHTPPLSRTSTAARHSISPSPPASRV